MTGRRRAVAIVAACAAGGALLALAGWAGAAAVAAPLVAAGLLLPMRLPWSGDVLLGVAAATAVAGIMPPTTGAAVLVTALLLLAAVVLWRGDPGGVRVVARSAAILTGVAATGFAVWAVAPGSPVVSAGAAGAGALAADAAIWRWASGAGARPEPRTAVLAYLALVCAGALVAVATLKVGVAMASIAAFPLLITRFAFERHAAATDTLRQTIQALGLVPELAGLSPLGHSERSAGYAAALAARLRCDVTTTRDVVLASRLHHLGAVSSTDELVPRELAAASARLAREAGLPSRIADLLEEARVGAADHPVPSLAAAIVRVAAEFDEAVGDDTRIADHGLAVVCTSISDRHTRSAVAALATLLAAEPDLVASMAARAERFREAAVGVDLREVTAQRPSAQLLRLPRRV